MKQNILIFLLVMCSCGSGILGAYAFTFFSHPEIIKNDTPALSQQETLSNTPIVNIENLESEITKTVEKVSPSIVSIIIKKDLVIYRSDPWGFFQQPTGTIQRQVGGGSGFFVKSNGTILTNKHVVADQNAEYTVILSDGREYDARVLAIDPVNDLAVIKIEGKVLENGASETFSPLEFSPSSSHIQIGQFAIAVGNALAEFQNSVSFGIISGKDRTIDAEGEVLSGLLQTDAAINPGNSGGPLMSLDGHVVGINTAIASNSTGIGFAFALTQERIDFLLSSIEKYGVIKRPFIGINYIPVSQGVAKQLGITSDSGVYILDEAESVVPGSPAEKAGLKPGDVIVKVNKKMITQVSLAQIIQNSLPGEKLILEVIDKNAKQKTLELTLGEY